MTASDAAKPASISGTGSQRASRVADAIDEAPLLNLLSLSDWYRFVPESLGILLLIEGAQRLWPSLAAGGTMPHPFWVTVLLMSGQYGIMGGLFATFAATGALFLSGLPPQSATQDFYAYAGVISAQPCAWLATALVMGALRTRHIHLETELEERLSQTQLVADDLANGMERAVDEIERLEHRIAGDSTTLTSLLLSLHKLDFANRHSLVGSIVDVVRCSLGAVSFTVCLHDNHGADACICVENGIRIGPPAALPFAISKALPAADADRRSDLNIDDGLLLLGSICLADNAQPVGVIVCSHLEALQDRAVAARRLDEICHLISALLPWCGDCRIATGKS